MNETGIDDPPPPYTPVQPPTPSNEIIRTEPTASAVQRELEQCRQNKKRYLKNGDVVEGEVESRSCLICCCFGPRVCVYSGGYGGYGGGGGCCNCCSGSSGCCANCSGGGGLRSSGGGGDAGKALIILFICMILFVGVIMLVYAYRLRKRAPESRKWLLMFIPGLILAIGLPGAAITLLVIYWNNIDLGSS